MDRTKCVARRDGEPLFSTARCGAEATHYSHVGRRCARHAEELKAALRSPNTLGSILHGGAFSEEEIARIVVPLA